jgi:hypothetical protein
MLPSVLLPRETGGAKDQQNDPRAVEAVPAFCGCCGADGRRNSFQLNVICGLSSGSGVRFGWFALLFQGCIEEVGGAYTLEIIFDVPN